MANMQRISPGEMNKSWLERLPKSVLGCSIVDTAVANLKDIKREFEKLTNNTTSSSEIQDMGDEMVSWEAQFASNEQAIAKRKMKSKIQKHCCWMRVRLQNLENSSQS